MKKLINTKKDPSLMEEMADQKRRISIITPPLRITDSFWLRNLIECPVKEYIRKITGNTLAPLTHFAEMHDAYVSLLYPSAEREVEVTYNSNNNVIKGKIDAIDGDRVIEHKRVTAPISTVFATPELLTAFTTGLTYMLSTLKSAEIELNNEDNIYRIIKRGCEDKYPVAIGCVVRNLFDVELYAKKFYEETHHLVKEPIFSLTKKELEILANEISRIERSNYNHTLVTFAIASHQALYYSILLESIRNKKYNPTVSLTITFKTRLYPTINIEYFIDNSNVNKSYYLSLLDNTVEIAKNPRKIEGNNDRFIKLLPCSICDYRAVCKFRKYFEEYDKDNEASIRYFVRNIVRQNSKLRTEVLFMNTP
jgi:hypothetical protein